MVLANICIIPLKKKIPFEFMLLSLVVDWYSAQSLITRQRKRAQSSSPLHKQALCHQYCRGIHTAGPED